MDHIHLETCQSTQTHLLESLSTDSEENTLVSCDVQTDGHGRRGSKWVQSGECLAMSFTLKPNDIKTITSLEVSCLISDYFQENFKINLKLKWPNDLLNEKNEKSGGIIINMLNENLLVVGIGLNLFGKFNVDFDITPGYIFNEDNEVDKFNLSRDLYEYILKNRLTNTEVSEKFSKCCFHINSKVSITDGADQKIGKFIGIGEFGEALLEVDSEIKKVVTGSLRVIA